MIKDNFLKTKRACWFEQQALFDAIFIYAQHGSLFRKQCVPPPETEIDIHACVHFYFFLTVQR